MQIKRMHDTGRTSFAVWICNCLGLLAIASKSIESNIFLIFYSVSIISGLYVLYFTCTKGDPYTNFYGEKPMYKSSLEITKIASLNTVPEAQVELQVVKSIPEQVWAQAAAELSQARREGLWARCFAEADADEQRAKASYLRIRAAELSKE